jgi:hypothetical protein
MSAHWLQGKSDSSTPLHVTTSAGGLKVATAHRAVSQQGALRRLDTLNGDHSDSDDYGDGDLGNSVVRDGCYSAEALQAVGLGRSPASKLPPAQRPSDSARARETNSPLLPAAPEAVAEVVTVKVLRAWCLPEELGGTNAYIVLDWGRYGRATTQAVANTTEPHFGSTLQFKSPYCGHKRGAADAKVREEAGLMRVFVLNRNQSVSDEMIASGEIDPLAHVSQGRGEPTILELRCARDRQPAGCLEFIVGLWPTSF